MSTLWQSISTEKTATPSMPACAQISAGFAYGRAPVTLDHALLTTAKRVNLQEGGGG